MTRFDAVSRPDIARWWWMGLHGGAGVTTLAVALPTGADAGVSPPEAVPGRRVPVVCVVRSHASGLRRAQEWAPWWREHTGSYELVGLVMVADAPGLTPKPLAQLAHLAAGGYPRAWRLPWVNAWRLGWTPDAKTTPAGYAALGRELAECFGNSAPLFQQGPHTPAKTLPIGGRTRLARRATNERSSGK